MRGSERKIVLHLQLIVVVVLFSGISLFVSASASSGVTCVVADGSERTLPASHINDEYCDCVVDGEDEPATSACAHISKKFVCEKNVDKKAISFAFVKDKICDCCDGSDEVGTCPDLCGKELDAEIDRVTAEIELHLQGEAEKKAYIKQGNQGVKQMDGIIKQLRQEVKLGEEELQSKIYSQASDQGQHLRMLEKLASAPSSFGPKREYYPLLGDIGKCYAMKSNEKHFKGGSFENEAKDFLFELCPFERVSQVGVEEGDKPTLLGVWQEWREDSDNIMIYSGGDECWNGPNRVVEVKVECGEEDKLVDVRENGKCTYEFILSSPAACSKKYADKLKKYLKQISPDTDTVGNGV